MLIDTYYCRDCNKKIEVYDYHLRDGDDNFIAQHMCYKCYSDFQYEGTMKLSKLIKEIVAKRDKK